MSCMPARRSDLIVSVLQEEVLVWDGTACKTWCLNATAGRVFQSCDGVTARAEVAARLGEGGEDLLALALADLSGRGLLVQPGLEAGTTRRDFLRRYGPKAAALPLVAAVLAPRPAHAQSTDGGLGPPADGGADAPFTFDGGSGLDFNSADGTTPDAGGGLDFNATDVASGPDAGTSLDANLADAPGAPDAGSFGADANAGDGPAAPDSGLGLDSNGFDFTPPPILDGGTSLDNNSSDS